MQTHEYDEHEFDDQYQAQVQTYQQPSSGVPRVVMYIGFLVVVNIILIAVDAPFYIY